MKNYFLNKLTQVSVWLGALTVFGALCLPRSFIVFFGILLIITDDRKLQNMVAKWLPAIKKALETE